MLKENYINRISVKLTIAFLITAISGVSLVALLAYRFTSRDFSTFTNHVQRMEQMMGNPVGGMMEDMMRQGTIQELNFSQAGKDFLGSLERALWISGLSGAAFALVLGFIFTRQIVSPISKISEAAKIISNGEFNQRVEIRGSDEIAELGKSFNSMAESLNRDRDMRHQMLADIAHELRTPLFILQGNTEAMLDGIIQPDRENLTNIHQETLHLSRLVEDLRTLSLAEVGQLKFQLVTTNLKELTSMIIDRFQAQSTAKNIKLSLDAPENEAIALVDPVRTEQVIRNLLTNAFKYTPENGEIKVRITGNKEKLELSVTDTGIGIQPEDLTRVFDRFYRADRSRTRSTGGSGLGLAIVKQLIEGQGGQVNVKSTAGQGSTFSFSVPVSHSHEAL